MSDPSHFVANNFCYGPHPVTVTCFNCKNVVATRTIQSTNVVACFLCGACCWPLCFCQNVEHRCPQCNVILSTYKPSLF